MLDLLERISNECEEIVICNNSPYEYHIESKKVTIFNFGRNVGIAAAQNVGLQYAFEKKKADYVVLFDQDTLPVKNIVKRLLSCFKDGVGIVTSLDVDRDSGEPNTHRLWQGKLLQKSCYIVSESLSSGSMISKKLYEQIGGMREDFFIDLVDFEYCWRSRANGFLVVRNNKAIIYHRSGEGVKNFLFFQVKVSRPIRSYYQIRNSLFIWRLHYVPFVKKVIFLSRAIAKATLFPIIFDDGRGRYVVRGIIDGLLGRGGAFR